MPPLTLSGIRLYAHLATIKLVTAQSQMAMPRDTVTKSVGTSTRSATPIQKSEKSRAVINASRTVPMTKEAKRAMGVKESTIWMNKKAYGIVWSARIHPSFILSAIHPSS
jgi:hypothetical protein